MQRASAAADAQHVGRLKRLRLNSNTIWLYATGDAKQ